MANAISDLGLPQADPDFATGGEEEGDGTNYGLSLHLDGVHRQNPDADRIWDDPDQLVALLASEEQETDGIAPEEIEEDRIAPEEEGGMMVMRDLNAAIRRWMDANIESAFAVPSESDIDSPPIRHENRFDGPKRPDNFRRHRQAVKRPRRDAARAKEAMITV